MTSITDALKLKHPEATGDTIAEVIQTMTSSGGGTGGGGVFTIEIDEDTNSATVTDATAAELLAMCQSGLTVGYAVEHGLPEGVVLVESIYAVNSFVHIPENVEGELPSGFTPGMYVFNTRLIGAGSGAGPTLQAMSADAYPSDSSGNNE